MFAFGKVIAFVIIVAIVLWFLSSFLFGWIGGMAKKRAKKFHDNFTKPDEDEVANETKGEVKE